MRTLSADEALSLLVASSCGVSSLRSSAGVAALRSESLRDCLRKVEELVTLFNESYMLTTGLATKTPVGQRRLKTPQERQ
ncbi:hypothetical protein HNQ44_000660 [Planomicrobium koreense]|uniref:Uncharacterized protein n=1 Tax=Planococcus koreensis TaxID=112331 RepID=A0A7W8CRK5_9BACL|nr:hypothetical protein [Planococcus koreensis]